jgi:hypothetical protein
MCPHNASKRAANQQHQRSSRQPCLSTRAAARFYSPPSTPYGQLNSGHGELVAMVNFQEPNQLN